MIFERYSMLITKLVKLNGTCRAELDDHIDRGEISQDDAELVWWYVSMEKLKNKLDVVDRKLS